MLALLSTPVRRWILASLLLPLIATVLTKVGRYLQRRNGGTPTAISRALLGLSSLAQRFTRKNRPDAAPTVVDPESSHTKQLP
ncbi:hypothetical protein CIW49_28740 [Mycolicibacterium sp. P1-18]|uniref:hypothetical protein n=1 Tax=Mycolicibacterium sp. P1-18 TaxID=2024615 RepID=UPI0011F0E3EE|nr:hypothetical protein [Mycolicibacterium sp. P1-18]KAA0092775.1 hypothetical protein CIW49_28740 [Mycolicibacterium sp. P1-18]